MPNDRMAVALKGQGVALDGTAINGAPVARPPTGLIGFRIRKEFDRQLSETQRAKLGELSTMNCAGREYIEILSGQFDFCLYRMTKPWDHAAGALMMTEAGGQALRFNGAPYGPADSVESGIIAAMRPQTVSEVRALFETVELPLLQPRG